MEHTLSEIWIYPIKSLSGLKVDSANIEAGGLQYDRRWMIVDENNRFLSQREFPEMALIQPELKIKDGALEAIVFSHKLNKAPSYTLENPEILGVDFKQIEVEVWDDMIIANLFVNNINNWLSDILGTNCRLVYMPNSTNRLVDIKYQISGSEITSFSDGYPFLVIGNEAIKLLNTKLEIPISMNRFRPNFVFEGGLPNEEDQWRQFTIGNIPFYGVKNCARCPIPTIDQETGEMGKEPLKTLSKYRFRNNKVYFGQNLLCHTIGQIKVGDKIKVIDKNN